MSLRNRSDPPRRQLQALSMCAAHPRYTLSDIANTMGVRASIARNVLSQAHERLDVTSRHEAVIRAEKLGLLPNNHHQE